MRALEFDTDLMVQAGQCDVVDLPDRIIQTTPAEPNFWFGNRVLFRDPPRDAAQVIDGFHGDLPHTRHICLGWDIPNLPLDHVRTVFAQTDLVVEQSETLALRGELNRASAPKGLTIRPLVSAADWAQSEAISKRDLLADKMPVRGMDSFLSKRSKGRRAQIEKRMGQWFGAFRGADLVGDMGIFHNDRLIRYQSVQTHFDHRRQGICSALLCASLDWARARAPDALAVIVANAESDAGRLYRRAGFAALETTISAFRPPDDG
ncbi:GNAT family N-acetyltransferase [Aliiroseovarius sp. CAU 1755]